MAGYLSVIEALQTIWVSILNIVLGRFEAFLTRRVKGRELEK
jgi:hypothetical protein